MDVVRLAVAVVVLPAVVVVVSAVVEVCIRHGCPFASLMSSGHILK